MKSKSVLIGGKAGEGINQAGSVIAHLLNHLGYRIYIYYDYPSLIRGGHNFSIIRASDEKIAAHEEMMDFILALNQDALDFHKNRIKNNSIIIYDAGTAKPGNLTVTDKIIGIELDKIIKEENAPPITRNSCIIGAFCKAAGIAWDTLEKIFTKHITKTLDVNLKVALRGYNSCEKLIDIECLSTKSLPIFTGNEALGLGLIKGGLDAYVAYPMTPTSNLLHFLAQIAEDFSLEVIHPENEISVILMALGLAYAGKKAAVGTSGGGFCLMVESLSLAAMAELPIVIITGQRPGPSTGLPTYTAQTDLHFILNAGHGEFLRFVVAPGDAEEAYFWSGVSLNISWKFQIPSIILTDKTLNEGSFSFDIEKIQSPKEHKVLMWDEKGEYKRYLNTETGISYLDFVPDKNAIIKVNSYEHDEFGITTEDPAQTKMMQDKRLRKEKYLIEELAGYKTVNVYGDNNSSCAILCWGSNKGVCVEAAGDLKLKVIHPLVMKPFPLEQFKKALTGVKKLICVENNATGQLARLINYYGFCADEMILKYDGRPFSLDELKEKLMKVIKWCQKS